MFRRKEENTDTQRCDAGSHQVWLGDLMATIGRAVFGATRLVRNQHIDAVGELYERTRYGEQEHLKPKMLSMRIPSFAVNNSDSPPPVEVPLPALVQHDPIVIDETTFELECMVDCYRNEGPDGSPAEVGLRLERTGAGAPARVVLKFKRSDPPEGLSRIDDALMRGLQ